MADWHPIMAAVEGPTGVWTMVAPDGGVYGRVELRRVLNGRELRYKAIRGGEVLGWAVSLREACWRVHSAYLRSHGPSGGALADWGDATRRARDGDDRGWGSRQRSGAGR